MVRKVLGKEHLHLKSKKDEYGNRVWLVLDDNNAIQTSDKGMSLEEVCQQMARTPKWAEGLILRADGYECEFYKKD